MIIYRARERGGELSDLCYFISGFRPDIIYHVHRWISWISQNFRVPRPRASISIPPPTFFEPNPASS